MMQELVSDLNMETQLSQPTNLYVNGENWGVFNIRERFDNHYFRFAHDVEEEDLDLLEGNGEVVEGGNRDYRALIDYVDTKDMEKDEHFTVVSNQMDMDNFLDYYIAQIYFGNMDWPQNNVNMWRERLKGNGVGHCMTQILVLVYPLPDIHSLIIHCTGQPKEHLNGRPPCSAHCLTTHLLEMNSSSVLHIIRTRFSLITEFFLPLTR
ncbi:hypothetical protein JCM19037_812 [Geomicrobium sp. JCM 19037]|nr:hypothetical protein JCM19037_812 [Geomicrobium sp. JCM 19037]